MAHEPLFAHLCYRSLQQMTLFGSFVPSAFVCFHTSVIKGAKTESGDVGESFDKKCLDKRFLADFITFSPIYHLSVTRVW